MARSVILDTDIGTDIDDLYALAMLVNSPELKPELILTATGNTAWRACQVCKYLQLVGRSDIDVGVGPAPESQSGIPLNGKDWVGDYQLSDYPGKVHEDGIGRLIDLLEQEEHPTIITIAPLTNIGELCMRRPDLVAKCDLIAMSGSIYKQHYGKPGRYAEYNVVMDLPASKLVYSSPWKSVTITPLDTCGLVSFSGERYRRFQHAMATGARCILENFAVWRKDTGFKPEDRTSILFDTVAIHLAMSRDYLKFQKMGLRIGDDGLMVQDDQALQVDVAIDWDDYEGYLDYLLERLCRG